METDQISSWESNILRPPTQWIENRCYRVLQTSSNIDGGTYVEDDEYPDLTYKDEADCEIDFNSKFEQLANGKVRTSFHVASSYLPFIVGTKGATKMRIENDTYTQIKIPSKGQTGDVVIVGKDSKTVREARIRIDLLVEQSKKHRPFTHFLSVPFNHELIQENFCKFKREVLEKCGSDRGVDPSLFQNSSKLHLTLCVLVLSDEQERSEAAKALEESRDFIYEEFVRGEAIRLELRGVEYMNDEPGEVDVLYGKVQNVSWAQSFQDLADRLVARLVKAGVATKQFENVKLHVTLMNTLFREDKDGASNENERRGNRPRESFDARGILSEFKDFYFGEIQLSEFHLSVRYSTASDGYYSSTFKIQVNS